MEVLDCCPRQGESAASKLNGIRLLIFSRTATARYWAVCSEIFGRLDYASEQLRWPRQREGMALAQN